MMNKQERYKFYNSTAWKAKRQEILNRDNHECVWCATEGKVTTDKSKSLEIDHIKELNEYPELALENSNLRTLCKYHHNKRHNRFDGKEKKENKWANDEFW